MGKYMGIQPVAPQDRPARELPCFDIGGTLFQIDIEKREFRQLGDPHNRMPFGDVKEEYGFSVLLFDTRVKNLYIKTGAEPNDVPGHVRLVIIPPLKELDPVGLARLHGFRDNYYSMRQPENNPRVLTAFSKGNDEMDKPRKKGLSV